MSVSPNFTKAEEKERRMDKVIIIKGANTRVERRGGSSKVHRKQEPDIAADLSK